LADISAPESQISKPIAALNLWCQNAITLNSGLGGVCPAQIATLGKIQEFFKNRKIASKLR
jgi:hypothetical protein